MKTNTAMQRWMLPAALILALAGQSAMAAADLLVGPGATQPGGDPTDTTVQWTVAWSSPSAGSGSAAYAPGISSSNSIAGSIYIVLDALGGAAQDPNNIQSPNVELVTSMTPGFISGWLGNPGYTQYDLSKYASVSFDVMVNTTVSSNTAIPITIMGAAYDFDKLFPNNGQNCDPNAAQDGWGLGVTNSGWNHVVVPLTPDRLIPDAVTFGSYFWYNTGASTPPAHVEFYLDNIRFEAATILPPLPTLAGWPLKNTGLLIDPVYNAAGDREEINTVASFPWEGNASAASPVTYSMTISAMPNPAIYSNFEAHIFLAPDNGNQNPDNNSKDVAFLKILDSGDGSALAEMHWKTNSAFDFTMLDNTQFGGPYGTNGFPAGFLGTLRAPTVLGTWNLSFTSDTSFTVSGPGGVQTNFTVPEDWVATWDVDAGQGGPVAYAYFDGDAYQAGNQGQEFLSDVSITGGASGFALDDNFTAPLDQTVWQVKGNNVHVVPSPTWFLSWTLPASYFDLLATAYLTNPIPWVNLSTSANVPVVTYTAGTNIHALVDDTDLPGANSTFFVLSRYVAWRLQVLMPGETNAPNTFTGRTGSPVPQTAGVPFNVTINATDSNWNLMTNCSDMVTVTSSDPTVPAMGSTLLANGTATVPVVFFTPGTQTITATDTTDVTVAATSSNTTVNP